MDKITYNKIYIFIIYNIMVLSMKTLKKINKNINNSGWVAGISMIMLNIGSRYITYELSPTQQRLLENSIASQLVIFSMSWLGTRDIVKSILLTASFTILTQYLFNEKSDYFILPWYKDKLLNEIDTNHDGKISREEIDNAIKILKKQKENIKK